MGRLLHGAMGKDARDVVHYTPRGRDVNNAFLAKSIASEFGSFRNGIINWKEVCFIQFLCVELTQCKNSVSIAPQTFLLAGACEPSRRRRAKDPVDEDASPPLGSKVDICLWFPKLQKDHIRAQSKVASERPIEGVSRFVSPIKTLN